jgi:hypothetical protein
MVQVLKNPPLCSSTDFGDKERRQQQEATAEATATSRGLSNISREAIATVGNYKLTKEVPYFT